jgi:hypothetical protein
MPPFTTDSGRQTCSENPIRVSLDRSRNMAITPTTVTSQFERFDRGTTEKVRKWADQQQLSPDFKNLPAYPFDTFEPDRCVVGVIAMPTSQY